MISKELFFLHEVKENCHIELMAEIEFYVGRFKREDSIKVIGEITDKEANVYELKDAILLNEFYWKFKDEIEDERLELLNEPKSRLMGGSGYFISQETQAL